MRCRVGGEEMGRGCAWAGGKEGRAGPRRGDGLMGQGGRAT
jgi:hypothetical protein